MNSVRSLIILIVGLYASWDLLAQSSRAMISETETTLKTYGFSDPDPLPILVSNSKIYPYHKFEGYSKTATDSVWKVVKLENEYIEVYVLPQVGGKVWGAVEKATGEEFIYLNEVMKFRNISMRGPWTSGGIEFNFGVIGHHPSTATPVDYDLHENQDGSVSCTVGNIDLPSRTQWRVEILLAPDKAFFETRVIWYNPTSSTQAYYNWMTGAALAADDLTFYCPGDAYLDHPGGVHSWPIDDEGRDLSEYRSNDFGGSKSYHVVGVYDDFFGGYYKNRAFGFGHWSPYESMPGQKLWLWALSRSGGIWEDLLTDTDGQYIEFQAGRQLNQFSHGSLVNPISKVGFEPGATDIWREIWFPVKEIGGLTSVSTKGVLHIVEEGDSLRIGLNALAHCEGPLMVYDGKEQIHGSNIEMAPMDVHFITIARPVNAYTIEVPGMRLQYESDVSLEIERPFEPAPSYLETASEITTDKLYGIAKEQVNMRLYEQAMINVQRCLDLDPHHLGALIMDADLRFRSARYREAKESIHAALRIDTYAPEANYVAGKIYEELGLLLDALEAYGWAARSLQFRADGYARMSEVYLKIGELQNAVNYARNALDFNRFHIGARSVLTIASRISGNQMAAVRQIETLMAIDPLNHLGGMEQFLLSRSPEDSLAAVGSHRSELAYQTFLELTMHYLRLERRDEALKVLEMAPDHPLINLWMSYLHSDHHPSISQRMLNKAVMEAPDWVFPYRRESVGMLSWADKSVDHWKIKYYLALNHWALGRKTEAMKMFQDIEDTDIAFPPFYLSRAALTKMGGGDPFPDLQHALELDKSAWRPWMQLIDHHFEKGDMEAMLVASTEAYERLPNNYSIGMLHSKAQIYNLKYENAIDILEGLSVLPFEGASEGRALWEKAHLGAALDHLTAAAPQQALPLIRASKHWPENLGVGKPYSPDEIHADYLMAYCYHKLDDKSRSRSYGEKMVDGSENPVSSEHMRETLARKISRSDILSSSLQTSWRQAILDQDMEKLERLEKAHPRVSSDVNYRLLKQSLLLDWDD